MGWKFEKKKEIHFRWLEGRFLKALAISTYKLFLLHLNKFTHNILYLSFILPGYIKISGIKNIV